jgi:hypothetical protein
VTCRDENELVTDFRAQKSRHIGGFFLAKLVLLQKSGGQQWFRTTDPRRVKVSGFPSGPGLIYVMCRDLWHGWKSGVLLKVAWVTGICSGR